MTSALGPLTVPAAAVAGPTAGTPDAGAAAVFAGLLQGAVGVRVGPDPTWTPGPVATPRTTRAPPSASRTRSPPSSPPRPGSCWRSSRPRPAPPVAPTSPPASMRPHASVQPRPSMQPPASVQPPRRPRHRPGPPRRPGRSGSCCPTAGAPRWRRRAGRRHPAAGAVPAAAPAAAPSHGRRPAGPAPAHRRPAPHRPGARYPAPSAPVPPVRRTRMPGRPPPRRPMPDVDPLLREVAARFATTPGPTPGTAAGTHPVVTDGTATEMAGTAVTGPARHTPARGPRRRRLRCGSGAGDHAPPRPAAYRHRHRGSAPPHAGRHPDDRRGTRGRCSGTPCSAGRRPARSPAAGRGRWRRDALGDRGAGAGLPR